MAWDTVLAPAGFYSSPQPSPLPKGQDQNGTSGALCCHGPHREPLPRPCLSHWTPREKHQARKIAAPPHTHNLGIRSSASTLASCPWSNHGQGSVSLFTGWGFDCLGGRNLFLPGFHMPQTWTPLRKKKQGKEWGMGLKKKEEYTAAFQGHSCCVHFQTLQAKLWLKYEWMWLCAGAWMTVVSMNECICDEGCMGTLASWGSGLQVPAWLKASTNKVSLLKSVRLGWGYVGEVLGFLIASAFCAVVAAAAKTWTISNCMVLPEVPEKGKQAVCLSSAEGSSGH